MRRDERHADLGGERLAAALAEHRVTRAVGGHELAHVLDDADDLHVRAARHVGDPGRDLLRGEGRSGDHQHLGLRQHARQPHLDVAGAGRHVDEQVVHVAPPDVGEELLERLGEDQAAPHQRGALVVDEEPHRHDLERAGGPAGSSRSAPTRRSGRSCRRLPPRATLDPEHARDAEAPDVGVEHADGAARAPRARPARFTVTDDLPTPPLPLATASTRVVDGTSVGRRVLARVPPGPLHRGRLLLLGHLAVLDVHRGDAAEAAHLRLDVGGDLAPQWAARRWSARRCTVTWPSASTADVVDHAEVDDAGVQLGVDDAGEHAADVVGATAAGPRAARARGRPGRRGSGQGAASCMLIKTGYILKICPDPGYGQVDVMDLAVLKALGDETRYAMYRELATVDLAAVGAGPRRAPRPPREHRAPAPRAAARRRPGRRRGDPPRDRRAAPAPLLPRRRRARARFRPARARAARRSARRARRAGGRRPRRRRRHRSRLGERGRPADPVAQLPRRARGGAARGSGSSPRSSRDGRPRTRPRIEFLHCPVPRARRGLPRAGVQPPSGPLRGRGRPGRRGKRRGVRDVVRRRAVSRHGVGRIS